MNKVHRWGMVLAFLIMIVCAWTGVRTVFTEDSDATVPAVTGMELVDAVDALQSQGLLAKVDKIDSPQKADTVVSQNLAAGEKVSRGKVIILRVSKGGSIMPMPDVRGLKFEDGVKRLSEAGFKVDRIMRVTDKLKQAGTIIAQNPAAPQQVPANCMVSLLVSTGATGVGGFVSVPDLRGQDIVAATILLEQTGLTMGASADAPSNSVPNGTVLSTKPRANAKVPAGTTVNITLARTPLEGELTQDTPPANDQNNEKAEAVRKVVVRDAEPSSIPTKLPDTPAPAKSDKPAEPAKTPDVKKAETPADKQAQPPKTETPPKTEQPSGPKKTAKVRYQVPPLSKPLSLKIEMTDSAGTRILKDSMANGSEYISMNIQYTGEAKITIYLGGDFVWQDRYN